MYKSTSIMKKFLFFFLLAPLMSATVSCNNKNSTPLYFTCTQGETTVRYTFKNPSGEFPTPNLEYSYDRKTWTDVPVQITSEKTKIADLTTGQTIYFRGENPEGFNHYVDWDSQSSRIGTFTFAIDNPENSVRLKIGGNVMSLLSREQFSGKTDIPCLGCFQSLFRYIGKVSGATEGSVDASELLLPATKLDVYCYFRFFADSGIAIAPVTLPAANPAMGCYERFFYDCRCLITAPEIKLQTLMESACRRMFESCKALDITKDSGKTKFFTCPKEAEEGLSGVLYMFRNSKNDLPDSPLPDPQFNETYYYN